MSDPGGGDPVQKALYSAGNEFSRLQQFPEAFAAYLTLARVNTRYSAVMGRIVASLAPQLGGPRGADPFQAAADQRPGDPLAQFVAGVASHYAAHNGAGDVDTKRALYEKALFYLNRVGNALPVEPRYYLYTAVSHFRLGHQKEAEEWIARAIQHGSHDPDVFYCRAEIHQRTNIPQAIRDIDVYLRMTQDLIKKGALVGKGKQERVRRMRKHLEDVQAGRAKHAEIWDPISGDEPLDALDGTAKTAAKAGGRGDGGTGSGAHGSNTAQGSNAPFTNKGPDPVHPVREDPPLDPRDTALYEAGHEFSRIEKMPEAFATYLMLTRRNARYSAVMGRLVASIAYLQSNPKSAEVWLEAARQQPGDKLAQFVGGVAAHYTAHNAAGTVEEKRRLYRAAIKHLLQARPTYDFEPRLYIYLAVSHYRLRMQKKAEEFIAEAVRLGAKDPDAFYCRAEILQRVDIPQSLRDLETYLAMTKSLLREGALIGKGKQERVQRMYEHLKAVQRGTAKPVEMFDPLSGDEVPLPSGSSSTSSGGVASSSGQGPQGGNQGGGSTQGHGGPPQTRSATAAKIAVSVGAGIAVLWLIAGFWRRRKKTP